MDGVPGFDLYATLGVKAGADVEAIEAAYRAAARIHHPDRRTDTAAATRRMQQLNVARDWLTDPDRRRRYDLARGIGGAGGGGGVRGAGGVAGARGMADAGGGGSPMRDRDAAEGAVGGVPVRGSMAGPILASLSVMLLLTAIFVGTGSIVTMALAVTSFAGLIVGIALTVRGSSG